MANAYGDVELDAAGMRALAHPVRLAVLRQLRDSGPATATQLSPDVGASPSVVSWHLRHLATHQLVVDVPELGHGRERFWRAASGFRFVATDAASRAAANQLQSALAHAAGDVVGSWQRETEPQLPEAWRALAGSQDTTITVTADELAAINEAVEALLSPYVLRSETPRGAGTVRILRHVLPDPSPEGREGRP